MKFAYADPPYLGEAVRLYGAMHPDAAVYDTIDGHKALIGRLGDEFPDGWALSLHQKSLRYILPLCPEDCRVGSWVKPFCSWKVGVNPAYAWEPLIFRGGRKREGWKFGGPSVTVRDYCSASMALKKGLAGAKPEEFCWWVFDLLGMEADDEFHDLFPGSGAVGRAWDAYRRAVHVAPLFAGGP